MIIDRYLPDAALIPEEIQGKATGLPITEAKLAAMLARERVQISRVVTRTLPKFRRGSPFQPRSVVCLCVRTGFIGADYLRVCEAQRRREGLDLGEIALRCRPGNLWGGKGEHVTGNRHLVRHRDRRLLYLVLYPKTNLSGIPIEPYREYFAAVDLQPLDLDLVEAWRKRSLGSSFPGTRKRIPWRLPCLGSIVSISLGGTNFTITGKRSKPIMAQTKTRKTKAASKSEASPVDLPAEDAARLQEKLKQAKSGESPRPRGEWQVATINAMGPDGPKNLARALNAAEASGWSVLSILSHGSSFLVCARRSKS